MKVLVVDDSAAIRRIIRETLKREHGWPVTEAGDVGEALDALHRSGPFDLVITDVNMPGPSGASLIRRLRDGGAAAAATRILVVSVEVGDGLSFTDLVAAGADGFLGKPFSRGQLLAKLAELVPIM
ncbi:MAG: response regulator [Deltaproteobacteria bacterium]|nr:response regulator [Deltaproteobacteria bacterium]